MFNYFECREIVSVVIDRRTICENTSADESKSNESWIGICVIMWFIDLIDEIFLSQHIFFSGKRIEYGCTGFVYHVCVCVFINQESSSFGPFSIKAKRNLQRHSKTD